MGFRPFRGKSAFWVCLATHGGRVVECHLPQAVMSAGGHFRLPRLPTEAGRLLATPQLPFPAATPQALSVLELRKRSSCARTLKGFLFFPNCLAFGIVSSVLPVHNK